MTAHGIAAPRRIGLAVLGLTLLTAGCHQGPRPADTPRADAATTSAVATDREWQGRGAGRVEELFVGRFAGVQVYQASGGIHVRIRGTSTLSGSTEPLYVVDGFPYAPGPDGLLAINPGDIAKIQVLKDAASLSEYGSRGANGVVLISTKRGR